VEVGNKGGAMNRQKMMGQKENQGFTLIELTFAMFVLVVGVLGGMTMILMGMTRNSTNRVDTTATNAAQAVMEEIAGAPVNSDGPFNVVDCAGTTWPVSTAAGGSSAPGGVIDFGSAVVTNYQMNYAVCSNNNTIKTVYDVRWSITSVGPGGTGKLVIVAARQPFIATNKTIGSITPVTLRTIVGM
jgi:Tfp pilus assembly protein PilV